MLASILILILCLVLARNTLRGRERRLGARLLLFLIFLASLCGIWFILYAFLQHNNPGESARRTVVILILSLVFLFLLAVLLLRRHTQKPGDR